MKELQLKRWLIRVFQSKLEHFTVNDMLTYKMPNIQLIPNVILKVV